MSDFYPYLTVQEKIDAYKLAIEQSLELSVHPEHLKRVACKLDKLRKFWEDELKSQKGATNDQL